MTVHKWGVWLLIGGIVLQVIDAFSPSTYASIPGLNYINSALPGNVTVGDAAAWTGAALLITHHGLNG